MKNILLLFLLCYYSFAFSQSYYFKNGNWLVRGKFRKTGYFAVNGFFTKTRPREVDSVIDLHNNFCIPPFGDAHTHNLDGLYHLKDMTTKYLAEGVFFVQVLGNNGQGAVVARTELEQQNNIDVTYANGLLTSTYGHGFFPYEPLAMGIYAPYLQFKYADSIKKSRLVENKAYYFLDSKQDVDLKWPLIMKYKPDHIKICLNDAEHYPEKRKLEKADDNGLSEEVAAYVVQKAHNYNLRVFAHVETANDARLCAKLGVDVLAHLPGYYWDGRNETRVKYCMTQQDVLLFKKAKLSVIPTFNIEGTTKFDSLGNPHYNKSNYLATITYEKNILKALYRANVTIALGADYFGKTVAPEIDSLIKYKVFSNKELLMIYSKSTPKLIFPKRKIGEIREGYEANFLVLKENPFSNIEAIKTIIFRVKHGKFIVIQKVN